MTRMRRAATPAALAAALWLAGCASPPEIAAPAAPRDAASLGLAGPAAGVDGQWWKALGDPQLDRLVAQALAGNPGLRAARARLDRARAVTDVADAALLPQVQGALDLQRQRYTATGPYPPALAGAVRDSATVQLAASWELDFFGKYREALQGALGVTRAAEAEDGAARVLLAASVVRGYVQLARLHAQLGVAGRALAQREEILRLVQDRVKAGLDSQLELRQGEGAVPDARAQVEALREQAQAARNALAALAGQPAADPAPQPPRLDALRPLPLPAELPADLLARRADITAARWRVEAASHDLASARTLFYPNVNLAAFAGLSSLDFSRLLEARSGQWGVGPAVRLPVFEGGRLRANLRGKAADLDAAIASYDAAVVDAAREAADQVAAIQSAARQQAQLREAGQAAEAAYAIALQRYQAGLANYLQVLSAETAVLAQRRQAVDLAARSLDAQAALARALGGGWSAGAPAPMTAQPRPAQ